MSLKNKLSKKISKTEVKKTTRTKDDLPPTSTPKDQKIDVDEDSKTIEWDLSDKNERENDDENDQMTLF